MAYKSRMSTTFFPSTFTTINCHLYKTLHSDQYPHLYLCHPASTSYGLSLMPVSQHGGATPMQCVTTVTTRNLCHPKTHAKANTDTCERTRASAAPLNRTPASERAMQARSLLVPIFVKSIFTLYLLYLDSSLSSRHIGIHMYPSALRPSCFTFYN